MGVGGCIDIRGGGALVQKREISREVGISVLRG